MYTTIIGNLGNDPELRFLASGVAVANFSVAQQQRKKTVSGEWEDEDPLWLRINVWREMAENVAETLKKGDRVVVTGRLHARSWNDNDDNKHTVIELEADEVGVALRFATAKIERHSRNGSEVTELKPKDVKETANRVRQSGSKR